MTLKLTLFKTAEVLFALTILFVVLAPVLWLISVSLRPVNEIYLFPLTVLPETWTLDAYREVWLSSGFSNNWIRYLFNTVVVSTVVSFATASAGMALGYVLSRTKGALVEWIRSTFVFVQLLEGPVLLVPLYVLLASLSLTNSLFGYGLVMFLLFLPFATILSYGFAKKIPLDMDEAARIDGSTPWQTFRIVFLPLAKSSFVTVFLMVLLLTWGEYPFAVALLEGDQRTVSTAMVDLVSGLNVYWNQMAAASVIVSLPVILILVFAQQQIVGGLTSGAVK